MKSYDEIYQSVLRRRDEQMAKKRRRIAVAGSVVLPAIMLSAAVGVGVAAWQGAPAAELPSAQESQFENVDIEVVDGKAVVAKCSLGGYTAELELTDITHEPTETENYFSTNSLSIKVTDPDGNAAEGVLAYNIPDYWATDNPYYPVELNSSGNLHAWNAFLYKLPAEHIGESLKLYELDDSGTKHYALALRSYEDIGVGYAYGEPGYTTLFFSCEPYSFDNGVLYLYGWVIEEGESGFDRYNVPDAPSTYTAGTSDDMRISGLSIINDGDVDAGYWAPMVYTFDPDTCSFTSEQVPQLGGDANVSRTDECDGYIANLRLKGLTHVPEEGADYYTAKEAVVTVTNFNDGTKATVSLNDASITYEHFVKDIKWESDNLWGTEVKGGVKLLPIEFEGEQHYVLALQYYLNDYDTYLTTFYSCEPDCFASGILYPYFDKQFNNQFIFSIEKNFSLLEGNVYTDGNENYEGYIRFDPVNRTTVNGSVSYVLAHDTVDGYTVSYDLQYMTHVAQFRGGVAAADQPDGYYAGEDAVIRVTDENGRSCEISLNSCGNSMAADDFVNNLRGDEEGSFKYCVKMLKLNDNGTDRYIIMLRNYVEENKGLSNYATAILGFDPETFTITSIAPSDADHYLFVTTDYLEIVDKDGSDILVSGDSSFYHVIEFDHANHNLTFSMVDPDKEEIVTGGEETAADNEEVTPDEDGEIADDSAEIAPDDGEIAPDETELPA